MTYDEQEKILQIRLRKIKEQDYRCASCFKKFELGDTIELSHIIPQRKWLIQKYGKEIIHHEMNMTLCHAGECNSNIQMSPNKTELVEAHVESIKEKIHEDTMKEVWDRR